MALMKNRKKRRGKSNWAKRKDKISQSIRNWTNMTFEILMVFNFFFCFVSHETFWSFMYSIFIVPRKFSPFRMKIEFFSKAYNFKTSTYLYVKSIKHQQRLVDAKIYDCVLTSNLEILICCAAYFPILTLKPRQLLSLSRWL